MERKLDSRQKLKKESSSKLTITKTVRNFSKYFFSLALLIFASNCSKKPINNQDSFSFNLPSEVHSLDPLLLRGTAKKFILFNLHRGLFYYNRKNELTAHGANSCLWESKLKLKCSLKEKKWSDGSPIQAQHYLNTYKLIKKQKEESGEILLNIETVENHDGTLIFNLKKEDKNFKHSLSSIYFSPRKEEKLYHGYRGQVFSGPYKISNVNKTEIFLSNNQHYDKKKRPSLKGVVIDDPSAALNMYNAGKIDFLRYLETSNIPKYLYHYMTPFARLDGIFFNPLFIKDKNFRKALFYSLDYKALQKIFHSPSLPGCVSLPKSFFKNTLPCYVYDLQKAQHYYRKAAIVSKTLSFFIPGMTSNDHKKLAQWAKQNWKNALGIEIEIKQFELGVFYENIKQGRLSIYRKAVSLNSLTCTEAKKTIQSQPEFKAIQVDPSLDCDEFFTAVLKSHVWLPLGMPSFAHLHAKDYSGYYINTLGQFGLEDLTKVKVND